MPGFYGGFNPWNRFPHHNIDDEPSSSQKQKHDDDRLSEDRKAEKSSKSSDKDDTKDKTDVPLALDKKSAAKEKDKSNEPLALDKKSDTREKEKSNEPLALDKKSVAKDDKSNKPLALDKKSDDKEKDKSDMPLALDTKSDVKNVNKERADSMTPVKDTSRESVSPISLGSKGPQSPLSDKLASNSRRKQSTPQKVPVGSSATNILHKKGINIPAEAEKSNIDTVKRTLNAKEVTNTNLEKVPTDVKATKSEKLEKVEEVKDNKVDVVKSNKPKNNTKSLPSKTKIADDYQDDPKIVEQFAPVEITPLTEEIPENLSKTPSKAKESAMIDHTPKAKKENVQNPVKVSAPVPCPVVMPRKSKGEMKSYSESLPLIPPPAAATLPAAIPPVESTSSPAPRRTGRNKDKNKNYQERDFESFTDDEDLSPRKEKKVTKPRTPRNKEKSSDNKVKSTENKVKLSDIEVKTTENKSKSSDIKEKSTDIKEKPVENQETFKENKEISALIKQNSNEIQEKSSKISNAAEKSDDGSKSDEPLKPHKETKSKTPKRKSIEPEVETESQNTEVQDIMAPRSKRMSAHKALMSLKMKEITEYALDNFSTPSRKSKKVKADNTLEQNIEEETPKTKAKPKTSKEKLPKKSKEDEEIKVVEEVKNSSEILIEVTPMADESKPETLPSTNEKIKEKPVESPAISITPLSTKKNKADVNTETTKTPRKSRNDFKSAKPPPTPTVTPTRTSSRLTSPSIQPSPTPIPAAIPITPITEPIPSSAPMSQESLVTPTIIESSTNATITKPQTKDANPSSKEKIKKPEALPSEVKLPESTPKATNSKNTKKRSLDSNATSDSDYSEERRPTKKKRTKSIDEVKRHSSPKSTRRSTRHRQSEDFVSFDESSVDVSISRKDDSINEKENLNTIDDNTERNSRPRRTRKESGSVILVEDSETENVPKKVTKQVKIILMSMILMK